MLCVERRQAEASTRLHLWEFTGYPCQSACIHGQSRLDLI